MRKLLALSALIALSLAGCSSTLTAPVDEHPDFACRGNSGNCGGGGGQQSNNPNNPPTTAP
jgi:hypothetical protein